MKSMSIKKSVIRLVIMSFAILVLLLLNNATLYAEGNIPSEGDVFTSEIDGFGVTFQILSIEPGNESVQVNGLEYGAGGALSIPEEIMHSGMAFTVEAVCESAFNQQYGYVVIEHVTLPDSVKSIGAGAFSHNGTLESVTLPNSVTCIEDNMFAWSSTLQKLILGSSTEVIGRGAFHACVSLEEIYILAELPPEFVDAGSVFSHTAWDANIYVPSGRLNDYMDSEWDQFGTFFEW